MQRLRAWGTARWHELKRRVFSIGSFFTSSPVWTRRYLPMLALILIVGIFLLGHRVHAIDFSEARDWIFALVGTFLSYIITFLSRMVILVTDILIAVSSYNNFVKAQPVVIGWVLVRDVCNMFFIVILLISAFSTIIGYDKFEYKSVLPKLLLMAIVINFSKTLIGLMIDFSQVLMLTFVNAYRQAAGGNMISVLQLDKVAQIDKDFHVEDPGGAYRLDELLPSAILAIVMLGISLTVLVILTAVIIARIVGLWVLLIMSPAAFFASALPKGIQEKFSEFTGGFWKKLSTLLITGPVVAFFLWLTMAIAQGSGQPFQELYPEETKESQSAGQIFSTKVGNASQFSSFFVAVTMLMVGADFALKSATSISSGLGKKLGAMAAGGGVAVGAGRLALRLGGKGLRTGGRVGGFVGRQALKVGDLEGKIGRAGLAASAVVGGIGAKPFAEMAGRRGKDIKAKQEEQNKILAGVRPEDRSAYLRSIVDSPLRSSKAKDIATMSLAEEATNRLGIKTRIAEEEKKLAKENPLMEAGARFALAESRALEMAGKDVKAGSAVAARLGDSEKVDKYTEAVKKNAGLNSDFKSFKTAKDETISDPKVWLREKADDSFKDSRAALAHLSALGLIDENGKVVETDENKETWDMVKKGKRGKYVNEHLDHLGKNPDAARLQLAAIDGTLKGEELAQAEAARYYVTEKDGQIVGASRAALGKAKESPKFAAEQAQQRDIINNSKNADEVSLARNELASKFGVPITEAYDFNAQAGSFKGADEMRAYADSVGMLSLNMKDMEKNEEARNQALEGIRNFDVASLRSGTTNEARDIALQSFDPVLLASASKAASDAGNVQAQQKIAEMLNLVTDEAKKVENQLNQLGNKMSKEDIKIVVTGKAERTLPAEAAQAVQSAQRVALASGLVSQGDLALLGKKQAIDQNNDLRAARGDIVPSARQAGRRAARAAGTAGSSLSSGVMRAGESFHDIEVNQKLYGKTARERLRESRNARRERKIQEEAERNLRKLDGGS